MVISRFALPLAWRTLTAIAIVTSAAEPTNNTYSGLESNMLRAACGQDWVNAGGVQGLGRGGAYGALICLRCFQSTGTADDVLPRSVLGKYIRTEGLTDANKNSPLSDGSGSSRWRFKALCIRYLKPVVSSY